MRIGIANDRPREVDMIRRALTLELQHSVAWIAQSAEDAIKLCAQDVPDLLLLDLSIPTMGGIAATRCIMTTTPCAILLMTADVGAFASQIFEAMGHGALDAIDTPQVERASSSRSSVAPFLVKLDAISRRLSDRNGGVTPHKNNHEIPTAANTLVAIGSSAGGPAALRAILSRLPKDFAAAVIIVQHMDQRFASGMVTWLSEESALPIRMAQEGDIPVAGLVLIASTNDHLVLKSANRLGYTSQPADYIYRPSVDVFFQSVAKFWTGRTIGVLLTGMGRDGAVGLKALRDKGHYTIAQDRSSSAVYGMPKAAIESGAAIDVAPADGIAAKLVNAVSGKA